MYYERKNADGSYEAKYNFHAISNDLNRECEEWRKCYGFRIGGTYTVRTDTNGMSSFEILTNVTFPFKWEDSKLIAITFAFPFGPWGKETELLLASRTYQFTKGKYEWSTSSMKTNKDVNYVFKNSAKTFVFATREKTIWESKVRELDSRHLEISATRKFQMPEKDRSWVLGTVRPMHVGFWD